MTLYFLFNENFLRVRCNGGGNSLLQDGNLEFWLKWFWESQFSGYRNKGWYSLENWPEHANKTASGAVPFPSILKIYGMFLFMFLQINIVMNNFGSSKFEQDEEIFESKNRKFIRDKIGEWRIQNGIIPDYKIRGHERK